MHVFKLIELWEEEGIQEQLEGLKRNKQCMKSSPTDWQSMELRRLENSVGVKLKSYTKNAKKFKDAHNKTGTDRIKWRFYDSLNEVSGIDQQLVLQWLLTCQMKQL